MVRGRFAALALALAVLLAAPGAARAAQQVLVLGGPGGARAVVDPALPALDWPRVPGRAATEARRESAPARAAATRRTVLRELRRLRAAGALDPASYAERRAAYLDAKSFVRRLEGRRRLEMGAVVGIVDGVAARGQLTAARVAPLWLMLERNREWWSRGPLLAPAQRVEFPGSELVWQYYAGQGLQLQVLGTFGKANGLWGARDDAGLAALLDEMLALAVPRAGGIAWESTFAFGGGRPLWVSGMSQGTGVQALTRAASRLSRPELLDVAHRALGIFRRAAPVGVRVRADGGSHYLLYSFAPGLRVLNGFLQSLIGLHDMAGTTGDGTAAALFAAGDRAAQAEVPAYDTGAWSLYSRGTSTHESDLGYHELVQGFLAGLCGRVGAPVYCDAATRFEAYLHQPPVVRAAPVRLRGGRWSALRFTLSKVSSVRVRVFRGARVVLARATGPLPYGSRWVGWTVPRRPGGYLLVLDATDLAGNTATTSAAVRVSRARRGG
jgi:hypothetical protein